MRRTAIPMMLLACLCLTDCGSGDDSGGDVCANRGYAIDVPGPKCSVSLSCGSQNQWRLDCSAGNGQCTCSKNGVEEKQVAYQDSFCPPDFTSKDMSSYYQAAAAACGWPS